LLISGKVLIAGFDSDTSAELYDPATGNFSPTGPLSIPRSEHTATLLSDGRVLIVGGKTGSDEFATTAEMYDPTTQVFTPTASLERVWHTATLLPDGTVLIAGGSDDSKRALDTLLRFDASTQIFSPAGKMTTPRLWHTATLLPSGLVLIAGGLPAQSSPQALASAELYDPATQITTALPPLHLSRETHHATLLPDGRVLITDGARTGTAEVFR
jgi:WD40 repeat protein